MGVVLKMFCEINLVYNKYINVLFSYNGFPKDEIKTKEIEIIKRKFIAVFDNKTKKKSFHRRLL